MVRETADQVFAHRESFFDGYLVVLSNDPIDLSEESIERKLARGGPLWEEIRNWPSTSSAAAILDLVDRPALPSGDGRWIVTDDRPILEYPHYLSTQLGGHADDLHLPAPKQGKTR